MSEQIPDTQPGDYFVSAYEKPTTWLLLGPFAKHVDALARVEEVRSLACELDPCAHFRAFGTVRLEVGSGKTGSANKIIFKDNLNNDPMF